MKRLTKLLAIIVVVVLLVGILSGCALFGRNTAKYRNQVAMTVGDEVIKTGKVYDYFISNYYNYYSYISQGYMTIDDLFEMTMSSLFTSYSKIDSYKKNSETVKYTQSQNIYVNQIANMQFLNQVEANFAVSYVKYNLFINIDTYVQNYIKAEAGELGTEDNDTSRDWFEYDDFFAYDSNGASSYAEYLYQQTMVKKDINEYFEKYYQIDYLNDSLSLDYLDYVFENNTAAQAMVDHYNELLKKYVDDQDEKLEEGYVYPTISATELLDWQQRALDKYAQTIKDSYGVDLQEYLTTQIGDTVLMVVVSKYDRDNNLLVESDTDFLANIAARFTNSAAAVASDYGAKPDSYVSFIEGLTNDSYIYNIPQTYDGQYIYVKNLLIPFTDFQKTQLSNWANRVGADTAAYKAKQLEFASKILARDFNVKDEKADDAFVADLFATNSSNELVISGNSEWSGFFAANSASGVFGGTDSDFKDLMSRFNTDVGQHSNIYDYVVRVGETPESYTAKWVPEFVDAANDAWSFGVGGYSMCISTYGIHIVYVTGVVEAWTPSFNMQNIYDTSSHEYSFLKTYYNAVVSTYTTSILNTLEDEYRFGGKVSITNEFKKLVEELGISYDFEKQTTKD